MELERWKWIIGYEQLYQCSDHGRVRSVDRIVVGPRGGPKRLKGRVLRAVPKTRNGYFAVCLCKEGTVRSVKVHRIVTAAWIGPCPEGQQVRHGPNGCADNSVGNLSYGTKSENERDKCRDGTQWGRAVVRSDGVIFPSLTVAAEEVGCKITNLCACCRGKQKTAGGYGWRYA
jgi:hypothetical protein